MKKREKDDSAAPSNARVWESALSFRIAITALFEITQLGDNVLYACCVPLATPPLPTLAPMDVMLGTVRSIMFGKVPDSK